MGKEIVYCGDCGKSLREAEFERGKAHHVDNAPYCTRCRPLPKAPDPPAPARAELRDASEARLQRMSATRRSTVNVDRRGSAAPMWIGGGLVAGILLVVVLAQGGEKKVPPPEPVLTPPVVRKAEPAPPPRPVGEARPAPKDPEGSPEALLREVERFAATAIEPMAVLQKCDEVRPVVRGTPLEGRLKEIERAALERQKTRQLEKALSDVRRLREGDESYARESEVLSMLEAARKIAGPRVSEVQGLIDGYKAEVKKARAVAARPDPPRPAPAPPPPPVRKVPPGSTVVTFQQRALPETSYVGARDTMLSEEKPGKNYGRRNDIEADGDSPRGSGMKRILLFGWDLSSIPAGRRVVSVDLTFEVTGKSENRYEMFEVKRAWSEHEATWRSRSKGIRWAQEGAYGAEDRGATVLGEIADVAVGTRSIRLNSEGVAVIQRWIDEPSSNFGILLEPGTNDDGLDVASCEAVNPAHRPKLTIVLAAKSGS